MGMITTDLKARAKRPADAAAIAVAALRYGERRHKNGTPRAAARQQKCMTESPIPLEKYS